MPNLEVYFLKGSGFVEGLAMIFDANKPIPYLFTPPEFEIPLYEPNYQTFDRINIPTGEYYVLAISTTGQFVSTWYPGVYRKSRAEIVRIENEDESITVNIPDIEPLGLSGTVTNKEDEDWLFLAVVDYTILAAHVWTGSDWYRVLGGLYPDYDATDYRALFFTHEAKGELIIPKRGGWYDGVPLNEWHNAEEVVGGQENVNCDYSQLTIHPEYEGLEIRGEGLVVRQREEAVSGFQVKTYDNITVASIDYEGFIHGRLPLVQPATPQVGANYLEGNKLWIYTEEGWKYALLEGEE